VCCVTEAAGGGGEARDTESKTRTPHKDVGKKVVSFRHLWSSVGHCRMCRVHHFAPAAHWRLRNRLWATLGRKSRLNGAQQRSSFIAQPNPTIVPGGRFLETYYWDTYWVVQGLIVCNMLETAKGVVGNLLDLWLQHG